MSDHSDLGDYYDHHEAAADHPEAEYEDPEEFSVESVKRRSKYSKKDLKLATNAVKAGMSCSEASRTFNIPRRTISDHAAGKHHQSIGRPPVLHKLLESDLSQWVTDCDALGDPRTPKQFLKAAGRLSTLSVKNFKNEVPSPSFVKSFLKRNERLSFRKPQPLTRAAGNVTPFNVQQNIRKVRSFLIENDFVHILGDPRAFGNGDETGYALNPTPRTVLARKGSKAYRVETANPKETVTVFNCVLASGESLSPQIVLKDSIGTIVDIARACGEVGANFVLQQTEKGWQTKKSFYEYISTKFVQELDSIGVVRRSDYPFVLFLDNHVSHTSFELFKWCKENHIVLVTFYPNSTHISQPLDYGVFGAAKSVYSSLVEDWRDNNQNRELKLTDFVKVLHEVQKRVFTEQTIKSAFRGTGVYPLNEINIHTERCVAHERPSSPTFNENARSGFSDVEDTILNTSSPDMTFTGDTSNMSASLSPQEKLLHIEKLIESVEIDFQMQPDKLLMCNIMKQQLKFLTGSTASPTTAELLPRPAPFIKSGQKRCYKMKNFGVMTSDEMLGKHQEIVDQKGKEEEGKENRRIVRLQQRELNETIRKMKKEATEEKRKRKAEEPQAATSQPKRRGRPPKVPKPSALESEESSSKAKRVSKSVLKRINQ